MATNTPNYNLIKPSPEDFADIADINSNMDSIDTALKNHADLFPQKVDKVTGKELSTNDFTDAYKQQVDQNSSSITSLQSGKADLANGKVPQSQLPANVVPIVDTGGTGDAYTASVDRISELQVGTMLIVVPHVASSSGSPTLNINNLGAKTISRRASSSTAAGNPGYTANWIKAGSPLLVQYDGTYWVALGQAKPSASDLSGSVAVSNGGTGKSSWTAYRLIYPSGQSSFAQLVFPSVSGSFLRQGTSGAPYWSSPSTVLSAIGALGEDDQAADSAKLGGQLPAYYSNYNNLTNKPSIPSATSTTPKPLGTATVGTSTYYARADHVHKMPSASEVGAVPTTRTVNGKALSSNIALDAADVGAKFKYDVLFACGESPRIKAGTIQLTKSVLDYNFIIILTCMSSNVYINAYTNLYVPVVFTNGSNTTICGVSNNVINSQLMRFMCKDGQDDDTGLYCYLPYDLNGFGIRHVQGIKLNSNE